MINKNTMCSTTAETTSTTRSKPSSGGGGGMDRSELQVMGAKSLLEDEEEEGAISRNPSLDETEKDKELRAEELQYSGFRPKRNKEWDVVGNKNGISCAQEGVLPICHGEMSLLPGCQVAEQVEFFTQCRHPLEFFSLSMFKEDEDGQVVVETVPMNPGMYLIPSTCEYCGAMHTDDCGDECQRPKSFFRKKRPPFSPADPLEWDPTTEFKVPKPVQKPEEILLDTRKSSFLSGVALPNIFGRKKKHKPEQQQ